MSRARRQMMVVFLLASGAALIAGFGTSAPTPAPASNKHPRGIHIRKDIKGNFGPLVGTIRDARCALEGKGASRSFRLHGDTVHRPFYALSLRITEWKGFGHVYKFVNGKREPGFFFLVGAGKTPTFSNAFPLPNPTPNQSPSGTVMLRRQGQVVSLHLVGHNKALTRGVSLFGSIDCPGFSD